MKIQPEYHLIVSEGTNTEPAYFEAIRDIINCQYRDKIKLEVSGEGDNTINLFWKAKKVADGVNAKKLNEINQGKPPSKSAPGTKLYELLEKLKPYLTENRGGIT